MATHLPNLGAGNISTYDGALLWAAAGWYVLPVAAGTKHPGSIVGSAWADSASRDPDQLQEWFAGHPERGVGVVPGKSGNVVVDIDTPDQWDTDTWGQRPEGLPTRIDGSRWHVFYEQSDPPVGCPRVPWGDIRGVGGFIVVAPTKRVDGIYTAPTGRSCPPLPYDIRVQLTAYQAVETAEGETSVSDWLSRPWTQTHPELLYQVVSMFASASDRGIHPALVSSLTWLTKLAIEGKLDPNEGVQQLRSAHARARAGRPEHQEGTAASEFRRALVFAVRAATDHEHSLSRLEPVNDAEDPYLRKGHVSSGPYRAFRAKDNQDRPVRPSLVEGVIPAKGIGQLLGVTYSGKSYLAAALAASVCGGGSGDFLGREVAMEGQGHVLVLASEGCDEWIDRIAAWEQVAQTKYDVLMVEDFPGIAEGTNISELLASCRAAEVAVGGPIKLVIVDTQSQGYGKINENDNTEMTNMLMAMKRLSTELGCFVLNVHHISDKATKDGGVHSLGRGASSQAAGMDTIISVFRLKGEDHFAAEHTKYKAGTPVKGRFMLKFDEASPAPRVTCVVETPTLHTNRKEEAWDK